MINCRKGNNGGFSWQSETIIGEAKQNGYSVSTPKNIGIVGFGFVGQAVYANISREHRDCVIYDKYQKGLDSEEIFNELANTKFIFLCLPTPENPETGDQDFSAYDEFFGSLPKYDGVIIVKSTVMHEYIRTYLSLYNIVLNPEFLNANTAVNDFKEDQNIILGGRADNTTKVQDLYSDVFGKEGSNFEHCSHIEAINIKYMHNIYHAYKVLFWNFCQEVTGNQRKVFDLYSKITGNTKEMQRLAADGQMGYGGACFPKDVNAFNFMHDHELTQFMKAYNERLRYNK